MPKKKPLGWPELMTAKRLSSGVIAYYWAPPTRAKKLGCPVPAEALGNDYGAAKLRCDEILNKHYRAWAGKDEPRAVSEMPHGTFDWMVAVYKRSNRYTDLPLQTRLSYDHKLRMVSKFPLVDGRFFGSLTLSSIQPGTADKLFERLRENPKGGLRIRTAIFAMRACGRAWNVARRAEPRLVPIANPFEKMGLKYSPKQTRLFTYADLVKFVRAADAGGEWSVGTAAMIAFFWLQRETDILNRLAWSQYRPADAPRAVQIFHQKTGVAIQVELYDNDGTALFPELTDRLDHGHRHGSLIVTRDEPDRFKKVHLPWKKRHFARRVAQIRVAANIDPEIKFMGLRHGGNSEGANAGLTDAQLRALSGHKTIAALLRYVPASAEQQKSGSRKRLESRTKKGQVSE